MKDQEISLEDLFKLEELQRIQDEFAAATRVASLITRPDGIPITAPSNFTSLCKNVIRQTEKGLENCQKSDAAIGICNHTGPTVSQCLSAGLWDAGVSINVGDRHIGNWLIGQVRDESQTEESAMAYAESIGADKFIFMSAFREVPYMPLEQFKNVAQALFTFANQLSATAFHNLQQKQLIAERERYEAELERIAYYDILTGLPNRALLSSRLQENMANARAQGKELIVAFIDFDNFKPVNDKFGHETGDRLLARLASNMEQILEEGDTLARLGGDEFVAAIAYDRTANKSYALTLERLINACSQPIEIDGQLLHLSASIGATFYNGNADIDADQLVRQADQAMYQAKQAGKNQFCIFDAEHDRNVRSHREGVLRIQKALKNKEFLLHYQPKVDLVSNEVVGVEALIRWQHPTLGTLLPSAFLHYLENEELGRAVGEWVINSVLKQAQKWRAIGLDITISTNISASHLLQPDFTNRLHQTLEKHPEIDPSHLELEILENAAMSDMKQAVAAINRCREFGIQTSLDDFGTGYSSLTYLRNLPVDNLKIDQSFVQDMLSNTSDHSIVLSVIQLAKSFNKRIIAEGVESLEQGEALVNLGCHLMQGNGIAEPMPAEQIPDWISNWSNREEVTLASSFAD